mmetsp:Transcript_88840/g.287276  ORF Transcript_88840/g.287276 Transcript_88840/m.287276 type:complete len:378 (-) Transcript_88840:175-1308(-)
MPAKKQEAQHIFFHVVVQVAAVAGAASNPGSLSPRRRAWSLAALQSRLQSRREARLGPGALVPTWRRQPPAQRGHQGARGVVAEEAEAHAGHARPDVQDVRRQRALLARVSSRKGDAEHRLPKDNAQALSDEFLLLAQDDRASTCGGNGVVAQAVPRPRQRRLQHPRVHRVAIGLTSAIHSSDDQAIALRVLLVHEGALVANPTRCLEPEDAIDVPGLARGNQSPSPAGVLREVDVYVPVAPVHRLLDEGLVEALPADDDVVAVLLQCRVKTALPGALQEVRLGEAALAELPEEPPPVLHLEEPPGVVQQQRAPPRRALRELDEAVLEVHVEELRVQYQHRIPSTRLFLPGRRLLCHRLLCTYRLLGRQWHRQRCGA